MNAYQKLHNFNGSLYKDFNPSFRGIEYDFEVPDNLVIASPGGVDSVRHHYTKGFYGRGNSSSDVYAGQQYRYIAGEYGNLYNPGHGAAQAQGFYGNAPDTKWWMNQGTFPLDNSIYTPKLKEDFIPLPDFDSSIDYSNVEVEGVPPEFQLNTEKKLQTVVAPVVSTINKEGLDQIKSQINYFSSVGVIMFILLFILSYFWARLLYDIISPSVSKGVLYLIALVSTVVVIFTLIESQKIR